MISKTRTRAALRGTVCAAAFVWAATAAGAQDFPSSISFDLDWSDFYTLDSDNQAYVEGALGAVNTAFEQTALAQLNNAAGRVAAGEGLSFGLNQYTGYAEGGIGLSAWNTATAWTTQLDAIAGGSQVAMTSFNTATFDVTAVDEATGLVELRQALGGDRDGDDDALNAWYFNLGSINQMEAAVAYAGTARIDARLANPTFGELIDNPDFIANEEDRPEGYDIDTPEQIVDTEAFVNGVQQAAVSLNTLRGTAAADTVVELYGQSLDVAGFSGRDYYDFVEEVDGTWLDFGLWSYNAAGAFSPRPATTEFVDPFLATDQSDPSIANLDQIAAISLNTMTFGERDGTADFTVWSLTNTDEDDYSASGTAQHAKFAGYGNPEQQELNLGNLMVATTIPEIYAIAGGGLAQSETAWDYMTERTYGIGDAGLSDVSQTAALSINSISQLGDGALTLKDSDTAGGVEFTRGMFTQLVEKLDFVASDEDAGLASEALNLAAVATLQGDVTLDGLSQIAQIGLNAISSGGDVNGWNDADAPLVGILQSMTGGDIEFPTQSSIEFEALNYAGGKSGLLGSVGADGIEQIAQISSNTLSAGGDLNAALGQVSDLRIYGDDDFNQIELESIAGDVTAGELSQVALLRMNAVTVGGAVNSAGLAQTALNLDDLYFDEGINDLLAETKTGNVAVDGISQIAQIGINTLSAGSIDMGETGVLTQQAQNLGNAVETLVFNDHANEIDVIAEVAGNASLKDASQALVLNLNTISAAGEVKGAVQQKAEDVFLDNFGDGFGSGQELNHVYVMANQDTAGLRNVGGNASIDGLVQTLAANVNTFAAGSLSGATVTQSAQDVDLGLYNYAMVDSEWGAASAEGIVQTALSRVNSMSIVSND